MKAEGKSLDRVTQEALVGLTRGAIESAVLRRPGLPEGELVRLCRQFPALDRARGAFVTIYVDGQLRGCLGEIEPEEPLAGVVYRCARRVPLHDYRFSPVKPAELSALTFKISVLGRPEPVALRSEIRIGEHGLIVRHDGRLGLLLPEVPVEHGWNLDAFLAHLWRKAGLDGRVGIEEARLARFTSQVLDSADFAGPGDPQD